MTFLLYLWHCIFVGVIGTLAGEYPDDYTLKDTIIGILVIVISILIYKAIKHFFLKVKRVTNREAKEKTGKILVVGIFIFALVCVIYEIVASM